MEKWLGMGKAMTHTQVVADCASVGVLLDKGLEA